MARAKKASPPPKKVYPPHNHINKKEIDRDDSVSSDKLALQVVSKTVLLMNTTEKNQIAIQVPLESDGSILVTSIGAQFPGMMQLSYMMLIGESNNKDYWYWIRNTWVKARTAMGTVLTIYPPQDGWEKGDARLVIFIGNYEVDRRIISRDYHEPGGDLTCCMEKAFQLKPNDDFKQKVAEDMMKQFAHKTLSSVFFDEEEYENDDEASDEDHSIGLVEVERGAEAPKRARKKKIKCYRVSCIKLGEHRCSRCKQVFFCSQECSDQHWPVHKEECRLIREARKKVAEETCIV